MASRAPAIDSPTPAVAAAAPTPSRHRESPRVRTALEISSPGDAAEREAEATARRVVAMPAPVAPGPIPGRTPAQVARAAAAAPSGAADGAVDAAIGQARGGGQKLPPAVAGFMGRRFGADFGGVRIHTDARAAGLSDRLGARAFTYGSDIFFAAGQFRPETRDGRELIAHELTHTLQQREAVQRAAIQAPSAAVADGLEGEAERAALAISGGGRMPALSSGCAPAIFRAAGGTAAAKPSSSLAVPGLGTITIEDQRTSDSGKVTYLAATVPTLLVPHKGPGSWVKPVYDSAASGGSLIYAANTVNGAFQTITDPVANYGKKWLSRSGFKTLKDMAAALKVTPLLSPKADEILKGFEAEDYVTAKCDVDHIVEKQLQGNNIQENLQLLSATTNRSAGSRLQPRLAEMANQVLAVRPDLEKIRLRFPSVTLEDATASDEYLAASAEIEQRLRAGGLGGQVPPAPAAGEVAIGLNAGGKGAVVFIKPATPTKLSQPGNLLITGMRLGTYTRSPDGKDKVAAKVVPTGLDEDPKAKEVLVRSEAAGSDPVRTAGTPATTVSPTENRNLLLPENEVSLKAEYPYMSPATIKTLALKSDGVHGTGVITPKVVKFLGPVEFAFAPGVLKATKNLSPDKLRTPAKKFFRFTSGELALELAPKFVPSGTLDFTVGPAANPLIAGKVAADYKDGAFVATGDLWPARPIPGISKAAGKVEYHSQRGWSGKLTAESSSIPLSTTTAEFSFAEQNGELKARGAGAILTKVKGKELSLGVDWAGGEVTYSGKVAIPDPLPLVKLVTLDGRYARGILRMTGNADIIWNQFKGSMKVTYVRKDGEEEGKFSGEATVARVTEKSAVTVTLKYNEAGKLTGSGTGAYQVTKDIRPELGLVVSEDGRIKATGEVKLKDISFGAAWPAPPKNNKTIVKGGLKFRFPTPLLIVNGFGEITGSLGVRFGVGPVMLKGVVFRGELYPLDKDPKINAKLKGALVVPAFGELYGTIGAFLGAEVAGGAVGVKGGIEARPALRVQGEAGLAVDAAYAGGAFSFSAEAYAKGSMYVTLRVDLKAEVSAGYGFWTHEWVYNMASMKKQLGPELKVTLGRIAYSPEGGMTWPSLSQIKIEPSAFEPKAFVEGLMADAKAKEGTKEPKPK
ncbi:MAG TPA: DUF4157 domain-containing protein [Allosphingosinicella sp.]|nr:DUF4157 domain-containing protein [Allosphingosinicella sp.]